MTDVRKMNTRVAAHTGRERHYDKEFRSVEFSFWAEKVPGPYGPPEEYEDDVARVSACGRRHGEESETVQLWTQHMKLGGAAQGLPGRCVDMSREQFSEWVDALVELRRQLGIKVPCVSGYTFEAAWAAKEADGYRYGEDALENVRFGWRIACETAGALAEPPPDDVRSGLRFAVDTVRALIVEREGRVPSNLETATEWLDLVDGRAPTVKLGDSKADALSVVIERSLAAIRIARAAKYTIEPVVSQVLSYAFDAGAAHTRKHAEPPSAAVVRGLEILAETGLTTNHCDVVAAREWIAAQKAAAL